MTITGLFQNFTKNAIPEIPIIIATIEKNHEAINKPDHSSFTGIVGEAVGEVGPGDGSGFGGFVGSGPGFGGFVGSGPGFGGFVGSLLHGPQL
jgi:hypothetical protein